MQQSKKKEKVIPTKALVLDLEGRGALVVGMDGKMAWGSHLHRATTTGGDAPTWRTTDIGRAVAGLWRRAEPYIWRNNVGRGDACVEA